MWVGTAAAVGAAAACGDRDEGGHHVSGGGAVPQDLHTEARERQVSAEVWKTVKIIGHSFCPQGK